MIASGGSASSIAAMKVAASGSEERSPSRTPALSAPMRWASESSPPRSLEPLRQRGRRLGGVALHEHVRAVVLGRVRRVDVDRHQVRRLGLLPALGHHGVEVRAHGHHEVGVVPEGAHLGHVRRGLEEARVARLDQAVRGVGEHQRRDQALGQAGDGLSGSRLQRAAAGPHERAA